MATQRKSDLTDLFEELSSDYSPAFINQILRPTGRSGQFAARDYIAANAVLAELDKKVSSEEKSLILKREDVKKYLDGTTLFRLNMYSPCLAFRYDELKPEEANKLFDDQNWVFTEKCNGCRAIVVHHKGKTAFFSRNYSVNGTLPEYWANIDQECNSEETFAFDAEVLYEPDEPLTEILEEYGVYTDSPLEAMSSLLQMNTEQAIAIQRAYKEKFKKDLVSFRLISPLYYKKVDYRKRTLGEGEAIANEFFEFVKSTGINIKTIRRVKGTRIEKEVFLSQIIDVENGEGVVAHNMKGTYCTEDRRDKNVFVKIKRSVGAQAAKSGMGDTIDAWVTGFKLGTKGTGNENLVAALEFSVFILKESGETEEHHIASVPNLELELKKRITLIDEEGNPYLDPQVYGMIGSVSGQNISYRSMRLTHPRLLEFPRFDKSKHDCIYSEVWIKSQIDYQAE